MRAMAMGSALALVALLAVFSAPLTLACGSCRTPTPRTRTPRTPTPRTPITVPPITLPPIANPPVTVPPVTVPPVVRPPVTVPPITLPPVIRPPVTVPPVTMPPVTVPPVTVPPVINLPPVTGGSPPSGGCPSPPSTPSTPSTPGGSTCSNLKLGACLDVLGQTVQIGDPAVECCTPLAGLTGVDAALCLCTTIKEKLLNINVYLPVALQLLASTCGKSIPPGYTCP